VLPGDDALALVGTPPVSGSVQVAKLGTGEL
jgi:hypothetical protein